MFSLSRYVLFSGGLVDELFGENQLSLRLRFKFGFERELGNSNILNTDTLICTCNQMKIFSNCIYLLKEGFRVGEFTNFNAKISRSCLDNNMSSRIKIISRPDFLY